MASIQTHCCRYQQVFVDEYGLAWLSPKLNVPTITLKPSDDNKDKCKFMVH